MEKTQNTLVNQNAIKSAFKNILQSKGYEFYSESELSKIDKIPDKYVIINSKYKGIYKTKTISPFKVINIEKSISERVEITYQKSQGSVDSKFPYFYLNAVLGHNDSVLMLVDGSGYKPNARKWVHNQIEDRWLMSEEKIVKLVNLAEFLSYIEENY